MTLRRLRLTWERFARSESGRKAIRAARVLLTLCILGFLTYRLAGVGWSNIYASLPETPWFYVIFAGMYVTLPATETMIFRLLWGTPPGATFLAMLKKRVYNKDVLGYSGEVYVYWWARRIADRSEREILGTVKDNTIISSVTSTLVAVGLLAAFFFAGFITLPEAIAGHQGLYLAAAGLVTVMLALLATRFRRTLFSLSGGVMLALFGVHVARLLAVQGLQVLQWAVVLPGVAFGTWVVFLSTQIIFSRIPLLPARDLLFIGAGLELSRTLGISTASVAGMLLVASALDKILNLFIFSVLSIRDRALRPRAAAPYDAEPAETPELELEAPAVKA